MKVCCISDLHGQLPDYSSIEADLFCICGDFSPCDIQKNEVFMHNWIIEKFKPWCEALNCEKVLFIAGNHDFYPVNNKSEMVRLFPQNEKVTYIEDQLYDYKGRRIYGTPWCKIFMDWAFMKPDKELELIYDNIPENLDLLLTHDCPYGSGDVIMQKASKYYTPDHIGNKPLLKAIETKKPKRACNGHLHSSEHNWQKLYDTERCNVAVIDETYKLAYEPRIFEI